MATPPGDNQLTRHCLYSSKSTRMLFYNGKATWFLNFILHIRKASFVQSTSLTFTPLFLFFFLSNESYYFALNDRPLPAVSVRVLLLLLIDINPRHDHNIL